MFGQNKNSSSQVVLGETRIYSLLIQAFIAMFSFWQKITSISIELSKSSQLKSRRIAVKVWSGRPQLNRWPRVNTHSHICTQALTKIAQTIHDLIEKWKQHKVPEICRIQAWLCYRTIFSPPDAILDLFSPPLAAIGTPLQTKILSILCEQGRKWREFPKNFNGILCKSIKYYSCIQYHKCRGLIYQLK